MNIEFVPKSPEDEDFLLDLFVCTKSSEFAALGWNDDQLRNILRMQYDFQKRSFDGGYPESEESIIFWNDKKIGRLICDRGPQAISLIDISILPEAQNNGVGTEIINSLKKEAADKQITLRLSVAAANHGARRLYDRLGFTVAGENEMYIAMEWQL